MDKCLSSWFFISETILRRQQRAATINNKQKGKQISSHWEYLPG